MARVCMRPGCDRPAGARISYDPVQCAVWLDRIPDKLGPVQEICDFHALRLTVPRGWTLSDLRTGAVTPEPEPAPPPEPEPEPEQAPPPTQRRGERSVQVAAPGPMNRLARRRHPVNTASQLFEADISAELPTSGYSVDSRNGAAQEMAEGARGEPNAEPEFDAEPQEFADPGEDKPDDLDHDDPKPETKPKSPLLARAFEQNGPQHSVLSDVLMGRHPDTTRSDRKRPDTDS